MRFKIQIDGGEHQIEAGANGSVTVGREQFQAKVSSPSDDRRIVQVGEKSYEVRVVDNCAETGIFVLELAGERVPVTVSEVAKERPVAAAAVAAPHTAPATAAAPPAGAATKADEAPAKAPEDVKDGVWAPVPGKIVDVFVKSGDAVDEGAAVLVLEAMKMENELHAPTKGTVAAVHVSKGDQVERGQLLVSFE